MPCVILIKKQDSPVAPSGGRWLRGELVNVYEGAEPQLGDGELDTNVFVRFRVTDKDKSEMDAYLQKWNRLISMSVFNGPDADGKRDIHVRNDRVNASQTIGAWDENTTNAIIEEWNYRYPTCGLRTLAITADVWDCSGYFTTGQAAEFEEVVIERGLADLLKRTIWYITEAGMQNIEAAGGAQEGTAQQLGGILRDGLLD